MSQEDRAGGASAARNKLAAFLIDRGLEIPTCFGPPENEDFWYAIQEFSIKHGAVLPKMQAEKAWQLRSVIGKVLRASSGT